MTSSNESYRNPVIPGFFPDPSVCRVDDVYYLVTSSFTYFPGVPIFRSRNLVDWEQIGNVLDRRSQLELGPADWASMGVYAPTIRHHDGRFWMITTVNAPTLRTMFVTATDPAGPWSEPIDIDVVGLDPDIAWDADGNCWVYYSAVGTIASCRIDENTGEVLDGPTTTWSGIGLQFPEAPHLYERDGVWYLLIAEGGTERGHAVSIARGPSPVGPWESCPANPIVSHRSTDKPIQNTGHADLVEAADGSWWTVMHGVRPKGITPGFHVLGRETVVAPVTWVDGWPIVDDIAIEMGTPPGARNPVEVRSRDDFDEPALHHRWISVRRPSDEFSSLAVRPGWLTLSGTAATLDDSEPVFVGLRQQHEAASVRTLIDAGTSTEAGLAVRMDELSHYEVAVTPTRLVVRATIGPLQQVIADQPRPEGPIVLTARTRAKGHGPDVVVLGYEDEHDGAIELAELDGRYLSTEVAGGFIGRVIGVYAVGGDASFDWFDYEPESTD